VANSGASLKADDVGSLNVVLAPWPELLRTLNEDVHPPLYFLLLKPAVALLGDAEFGLRSLSILLYWLSGVAMYRLARRFLPPEGALIAAAVFLTAPLASLSAELVRMYSLLALLAILSTTALIDFVQQPSRRRMAVFAGLTICGTFTHLWYFCLLAGQGLAVLVRAPRQVGRVSGAVAAGVVPYALLWLPVLLRQLDRSHEAAAWLPPPDLEMLPHIAFLWLGMTFLLLPWVAWHWRRLVAGVRESGAEAAAWSVWLLVGSVVPPLAVSFALHDRGASLRRVAGGLDAMAHGGSAGGRRAGRVGHVGNARPQSLCSAVHGPLGGRSSVRPRPAGRLCHLLRLESSRGTLLPRSGASGSTLERADLPR
jgi:hypothetical protein